MSAARGLRKEKIMRRKVTALFLVLLMLVFPVSYSPVTVFAETVNGSTDISSKIKDSKLLSVIRDKLGKSKDDKTITVDEMSKINCLYANGKKISSLSGLEYATNLQDLYLEYNNISDLTPLSGLTNLKYLNLNANKISDIKPLAGLTNLQELDLGENDISDIKPLAGLKI
jgi:internalin A